MVFKKLTCSRLKAFSWGNFLIRILRDAFQQMHMLMLIHSLAFRSMHRSRLRLLMKNSTTRRQNKENAAEYRKILFRSNGLRFLTAIKEFQFMRFCGFYFRSILFILSRCTFTSFASTSETVYKIKHSKHLRRQLGARCTFTIKKKFG